MGLRRVSAARTLPNPTPEPAETTLCVLGFGIDFTVASARTTRTLRRRVCWLTRAWTTSGTSPRLVQCLLCRTRFMLHARASRKQRYARLVHVPYRYAHRRSDDPSDVRIRNRHQTSRRAKCSTCGRLAVAGARRQELFNPATTTVCTSHIHRSSSAVDR